MNSRVFTLSAITCLAVAVLFVAAAVEAAGPVNGIITGIDKQTRVVSAKADSGRSFKFKVSAAVLRSLRVGQKVSANLDAKTVTLPAVAGRKAVKARITYAEPVGAQAGQPTGAVASPAVAASDPLGSGKGGKRPIRSAKDTGDRGGEAAACKAAGGEWRCTTVSTGSDPGPGDDTISCHCIRHK